MTWCKLDDQFHAHRKAKRAWKCRPALGLHMLALSYCASQLTDGAVDREFVEEKLPNAKERDEATAALCDAGLWELHEDGFMIHDYLDHNPSRADVLERRKADADRKADARAAKAASRQSPQSVRADTERTPPGFREASALPDPTRPDPTRVKPPNPPQAGGDEVCPDRPVGSRVRELARYREQLKAFAERHFPGVHPDLVAHCASMARRSNVEPTAEALRPVVDAGGVMRAVGATA